MIENIKEKEEEVKAIWLKNKGDLPLGQFYRQFLSDYFNTEGVIKGTRDWLFFLNWFKEWRKEEKKEQESREMEERLREVPDEEVEETQKRNRKKMILILEKLLDGYELESSIIKKAFSIGEIRRLYQSIQSLEEKMKMTEISRGKLKLDAVRTLLPYKRLKPEELIALKGKLNESFDRIIKLKKGEPVGQSAPNSG